LLRQVRCLPAPEAADEQLGAEGLVVLPPASQGA
jgi:hypothetical protein